MKIKEAAQASGLSVYTIRFYEKSGMLPNLNRGPDGHRCFSKQDVDWLTLLYWLRETGMGLQDMRQFTRLAKQGASTISERRSILLQHSQLLKAKRELLDKCDQILARKVEIYDEK